MQSTKNKVHYSVAHILWKATEPFWAAMYECNSNDYLWVAISHGLRTTRHLQLYDIMPGPH